MTVGCYTCKHIAACCVLCAGLCRTCSEAAPRAICSGECQVDRWHGADVGCTSSPLWATAQHDCSFCVGSSPLVILSIDLKHHPSSFWGIQVAWALHLSPVVYLELVMKNAYIISNAQPIGSATPYLQSSASAYLPRASLLSWPLSHQCPSCFLRCSMVTNGV